MEGQAMKIGVVGSMGMVGGAVAKAFGEVRAVRLSLYDVRASGTDIRDVIDTAVCFVAVPAATQWPGGSVALNNLHTVLEQLRGMRYLGEVVIKSTVPPGTCSLLSKNYPTLKIVHNPEFLRERHAVEDFVNQKAALLSGPDCRKTIEAYHMLNHNLVVHHSVNYADTELAKYIHNTWLAMKVIYMNQIDSYQDSSGFYTNKMRARDMAASQGSIGDSHMAVPGPDGRPGFGGSCFIKDTLSFYSHAQFIGVELSLLSNAIEANKVMRPTAYDGTESVGLTK
jgi:UDPglucose 6-dehydrogenase